MTGCVPSSLDFNRGGYKMNTLREVIERGGKSNRQLADEAGISFRAIAQIRSGEWDEAIRHKIGGYTGRKRIGAIQVMARVLVACGEDPKAWIQASGISLTPQDERAISGATSRRPKPLTAHGLGPEEWNALLVIADSPLTKEDIDQLARAQEVLGEFFTIKLAIELLISKHKKHV